MQSQPTKNRFFLLCALLLQAACAALPNQAVPRAASFSSPPKVGSTLVGQQDLVACTTVFAAKNTSANGFMHPDCTDWPDIEPNQYRVMSRELIELAEGDVWLLEVHYKRAVFWVPFPWHDWI